MTRNSPPHLYLVKQKPDPMSLLNHLMIALCESYNLDLTKTTSRLQNLIIELQREVVAENMDHQDFHALANFITRIAESDEKTIKEFVQYVEQATP